MNAGVSSEKEKVKESQLKGWHPRLTPTSGAELGASHKYGVKTPENRYYRLFLV